MIEKRVRKLTLHESGKPAGDLSFWLSRPAEERIAAVELLKAQYHGSAARLQRRARVLQQKRG
jgi:hypothetical protein